MGNPIGVALGEAGCVMAGGALPAFIDRAVTVVVDAVTGLGGLEALVYGSDFAGSGADPRTRRIALGEAI